MTEGSSTPGGRTLGTWLVAFALGLLLAVGIGYAWRQATSRAPVAPPEPPAPPAKARSGADERPAPVAHTSAAAPLAPRGSLELSRASFPSEGPVVVHLALPEPSRDDAPRPVRLVSQPDHRVLEIEGALADGRGVTTIEVDPAYLQPGEYLVEVKTTERTHFPLRRYVLVVRE